MRLGLVVRVEQRTSLARDLNPTGRGPSSDDPPGKACLAWFWTLVILVLCWIPRSLLPGTYSSVEGRSHPDVLRPQPRQARPSGDLCGLLVPLDAGGLVVEFRAWKILGRRGWLWRVVDHSSSASLTVNRDCNVVDGLADSVGVPSACMGFSSEAVREASSAGGSLSGRKLKPRAQRREPGNLRR